MLTIDAALERLTSLIDRAKKAGATAADAIYVEDASVHAQVRLGELEDVSRSEGAEIGLRVFAGNQVASVSTSDVSTHGFDALVERAVAMARAAPADPYAGLAPEELLLKGGVPDLDLYDETTVDADLLKMDALAAEEAARAVPGVSNSEGASASAGEVVIAIATSHGVAHGYRTTSHGVSATVVAEGNGGMERDYDYASARHRSDLMAATEVGRRAGERAVRRVNPVKLASETMPVVYDPRIASGLVGHLIGAITGASIARKSSFLLDARGKPVFAPGVTIREEPLRQRGLRSRPMDGEGLPTRTLDIVSDGVLTTWLMDSASARQLGEQPTGHASRGISGPPGTSVGNLMLMPGAVSREDLLRDIKRGLYVVELIGSGVNGITGDYSRGAAGFLIENGEITTPVSEITIAGNLKEMFATLVPASDLELRYGVDAPTVMIPRMTVAGN